MFYSDDEPISTPEPQKLPAAPQAVPADDAATDSSQNQEGWWQQGSGDSAGVITSPLPQIPTPEHQPVVRNAAALTPSERGMAFAALRDIGQLRSVNQDSVLAMVATVPRAGGDVPLGLFVVADGMGGHEGGEIASRIAISTVAREVLRNLILPSLDDTLGESLQQIVTTAVQEANRAIWTAAQAAGSDMGTTCTAAILIGHTVYLGHVGDSRAYLVDAGGLRPLTTDHSAVGRLIELGQLAPSEAREHPQRSQLYRTVGQLAEIAVDYEYHQVGSATHLLLCSDGLWGMIDEAEMLEAVRGYTWPQDICQSLIDRANAAGGDDNISAVVVALP
ncbi:MAG: serine/threonine-protein phosphatase [Roseiflexaceae bacterium]|nr:serine/threonine-protein phosphatase [Roseiflexaceae bacterium]